MLKSKISAFISYCKVSGYKDKSLESLHLRLSQFNSFVKNEQIKHIDAIEYRHLRRFVADYQQPSIHVKKARIWSLRHFYHYLILHGYVQQNPAGQLAYPRMQKSVAQFLTIDEYNHIVDHFAKTADTLTGLRDLIIILMLGTLGLRTNAIVGLNRQDLNLVAGLIWIREKGGITRMMVLPKVLCALLQGYLDRSDHLRGPLFLSNRQKRLSMRSLQDIFSAAAKATGIEKHLHAHLFRHTAGAHINKVGGTSICQYVLGHAWRKNSAKYTHLNPDHYAVYMRLHPFIKEDL